MANTVVGAKKIKPAFDAMRTGRGGVIMIGDSNQVYGTPPPQHGWDAGWTEAMRTRVGIYGTQPFVPYSLGVGVGYGYSMLSASPGGSTQAGNTGEVAIDNRFDWSGDGSGTPNPDAFGNATGGRKHLHLPTGTSASNNYGIRLGETGIAPPFNITQGMRWHFELASFEADSGGYRIQYRLETSPFTQYALRSAVTILDGASAEWIDSYDDIAADANLANFIPFALRFSTSNSFVITAKFTVGHMWVEDRSANGLKGAKVGTLIAQGGGSLYDMARAIAPLPGGDQLKAYFRHYHQPSNALVSGGYPVIVRICSATNDRTETGTDINGDGNNNNTGAGYYSNLTAMRDALLDIWVNDCGYDPNMLYFLITPTHTMHAAAETTMRQFRDAALQFAADWPNCCSVDFSAILTYDQMNALGYYESTVGEGPSHLASAAAYIDLAGREIDAILNSDDERIRNRRVLR